jgi:glucokinase
MAKRESLYVGVDVGGTKIVAALVRPSGEIVARSRSRSPRDGGPQATLAVIQESVAAVLAEGGVGPGDLAAVGIGIPGVVDPAAGRVVVTPNMNLSGTLVAGPLGERFRVPVAIGNDVNLGMLGEAWLGAARSASSAVGIFVGTGIGGGIIIDGRLVRGARETAGEIGHMVMQIDGPTCGCGNRGCLEALASRTAIERDLRAAVAAGAETVLRAAILEGPGPIRSKKLRRAIEEGDALAQRIVRRAAEVIGLACLNVRHLVDPEVIVLGGGVIEACGDFMMPVIEAVVAGDALAAARPGGAVVRSALGDDAVVLGAAALARQAHAGGDADAAGGNTR